MSTFGLRNIMGCSVVLITLFAGASGAVADGLCETVEWSGVNTVLRTSGDPASGRQCFTTELPSAGWLLLEATVPSTAAAEPRLELLGRLCDPPSGGSQSFRYRTRSASSLLLEVSEAGGYQFCVAPQDRAQVLGDYVVVNAFAPFDLGKDGNEHEPEPDPFASDCRSWSVLGKDGNEHEPEPDPFASDCRSWPVLGKDGNEHEPEPDPFASDSRPGNRLSAALQELCRQNQIDDVADIARCAREVALDSRVTAELGNGWGDDGDLFTFRVDDLATVRIESSGAIDVSGGLYDRWGYRLNADDDGGSDGNFRIVRTLGRGRYFVRVDSQARAEGAYEVSFQRFASQE